MSRLGLLPYIQNKKKPRKNEKYKYLPSIKY